MAFIAIEGIDGAGTTTQARLVAQWIADMHIGVAETSEPTHGPIGQVIRQFLSHKNPSYTTLEKHAQLLALLFAADRLQHMATTVLPALNNGQHVVTDRCYLSSFAYQSIGAELDWIRSLNRDCRRADVIVVLDIDAAVAHERIVKRTLFKDLEVFETVEKMEIIRRHYLDISATLQEEGDDVLIIGADCPVDVVTDKIKQAVLKHL